MVTDEKLKEANKQISKAIRKDLRSYKRKEIEQIIENNKSMKILRRKLSDGRKDICKIRNHRGEFLTNRREILNTGGILSVAIQKSA